jgi:DNA-binding transcriptional LysR family regulator
MKRAAAGPLLDPMLVNTFLAVAEEGSISAGARRVFRTQSTASTQIQALEEQLGARLFDRDTRRLALTEQGTLFMAHARRLLEVNQAALSALRSERPRPLLRIGFSEYFRPEQLGRFARRLHVEWPEHRFELRVAQSRVLEQEFEAEQLDLAVVSRLTRTRAAAGAPRRGADAEPLHWVSAPQLSLPERDALPLVLLPPDCPLHALALTALARAGLPHYVAVTCSGTAGVIAALRGGLGVGCLNESAIVDDLARCRHSYLPALPSLRFEWRARKGTPAAHVAALLRSPWA